MRITICGHAGLMVEAGGETVLLDPILRSTPLGIGSTVYWPGRRIEPERMPAPSIVVITHAHFDHFDRESLQRLSRSAQFVVPRDPRIRALLEELGCTRIQVLAPWERFERGGLQLTATPSTAPVVEDEFGVLFQTGTARFWHMSDAEVTAAVGARLRAQNGRIHVVSAKYQPQARAHLDTMFSLGAKLDKRELFEWLESAAIANPLLVFPYAAGVVLDGEHAWMNRHVFPVNESEICALFGARLGDAERASTVRPGDVIAIESDSVVRLERQAAAFVRHDADVEHDCSWEPLGGHSLLGVASQHDANELEARLDALLAGGFATWLARELIGAHGSLRKFIEYGVRWQLIVHCGPDSRLEYGLDFTAHPFELCGGVLADANYFVHVSGHGLLRALRSNDLAVRNLFSCAELRLYEKIMHVRGGQFWAPPVEGRDLFLHELPEPLATYLGTVAPAALAPAASDTTSAAAAGA